MSGKKAEKAEEKKQPEKSEKEEGKKEGRPEKPKKADTKKEKRIAIIRMGGKDLDGDMPLKRAIRGITGVSFMFANAICRVTGLGEKKLSEFSDGERKEIEEMMKNPGKHGIPEWVYNRRSDPEDGENKHLVSADLDLKHKMDINELKKRRCYRGVRHIAGLPVRGQRTRGSFRKASTVGVVRQKAAPAAKKKE